MHFSVGVRWIPLVTLALYPLITGFVLLSKHKATLPISPDQPKQLFVWDGKAPEIEGKDKYGGGLYQNLNDQEFMQQLLKDSVNVWNAVPGAYVVLEVTSATGEIKADGEDGQFVIVTESSQNASAAAFAKPNPKPETPNIISDCDITIADRKTQAKDLAYTIAHELGHCLGLGHSHTNYSAMMGYSRMTRSLELGADDAAGIVYLYPDPTYVTAKPKEAVCGVAGQDANSENRGLMLLLLPIATFFGAFLVRRLARPLSPASWSVPAKTAPEVSRNPDDPARLSGQA